MQRSTYKLLCSVLALLATWLVLGKSTARAQDITSAVYRDTRAVIDDLITQEVAHSVVPNMVCRAGAKRLEKSSKNVSEIKCFEDSDRNLKCTEGDGDARPDPDAYDLQLIRFYPRTLQKIFNRQFGSLRSTLLDESASMAAYAFYRELVPEPDPEPSRRGDTGACVEAVQALSDELTGAATLTPSGKVDDHSAYTPIASRLVPACSEEIKRRFARDDFLAMAPSDLEKACASTGVSAASHAYACELAFALRAHLKDRADLTEEHLVRATAVILSAKVVDAYPAVDAKKKQQIVEQVMASLRDLLANPTQPTAAFEDALTRGLSSVLEPGDAAIKEDTTKLKEQLKEALKGAAHLALQWKIATNAGARRLDISRFTSVIASGSGALFEICAGSASAECKELMRYKPMLELGGIASRYVSLASRGDGREAAFLAMQSVFPKWLAPETCAKAGDDERSEGNCTALVKYKNFVLAVVVYVLDVSQDNAPSEATSAAFRQAAVEIVQELATGGGISRRWFSRTFFLPDLALRVSWSGAYLNESEGSVRFVASANMLNFRVGPILYKDLYYLAIHASLADPLAPLTEIALRRKVGVTYDSDYKLAANLIAPRMDLVFGVPALSKHVVVGAGLSLRVAAPRTWDIVLPGKDSGMTTKVQYKYLWEEKESWPQFLEFGFAVKYIL